MQVWTLRDAASDVIFTKRIVVGAPHRHNVNLNGVFDGPANDHDATLAATAFSLTKACKPLA